MESKRNIDSELGLFIYQIIDKSGITKELLADKLNVSTRTVYGYCTGERKCSLRKWTHKIKIRIKAVKSM